MADEEPELIALRISSEFCCILRVRERICGGTERDPMDLKELGARRENMVCVCVCVCVCMCAFACGRDSGYRPFNISTCQPMTVSTW